MGKRRRDFLSSNVDDSTHNSFDTSDSYSARSRSQATSSEILHPIEVCEVVCSIEPFVDKFEPADVREDDLLEPICSMTSLPNDARKPFVAREPFVSRQQFDSTEPFVAYRPFDAHEPYVVRKPVEVHESSGSLAVGGAVKQDLDAKVVQTPDESAKLESQLTSQETIDPASFDEAEAIKKASQIMKMMITSMGDNSDSDDYTTQSGERPFSCEVCKKSYPNVRRLKCHQLAHTNERPFPCNVCNKLFKSAASLKQHHNVHTEDRPFKCDVCEKTFRQKGCLKSHKLMHSGERPFSCDVCKKQFTAKSNLYCHKLLHTDYRPFSCDICKKSFIRRKELLGHKAVSDRKNSACMRAQMLMAKGPSKLTNMSLRSSKNEGSDEMQSPEESAE